MADNTNKQAPVDPGAVLQALGVRQPEAMAPLPGGGSASIWRVVIGARPYVLRVYRRTGAATYAAEIAALRMAQRTGMTVPAVRLIGRWQDRPVLLIDWCEGEPVGHVLRQHPWSIWHLGQAFGRAQAHLHLASATLGFPPSEDWIRWGGDGDPSLAALLARLNTSTPALLHLDYHPLNVLTDGRRITALIDWANAQVGDPRADVARTYSMLMVEPWTPGPQPLTLTVQRRVLTAAWLRGYQLLAGPLGDLRPFLAWAGEAMVRNLAPRVTNPDSWWGQRHLDQIAAWAEHWRRVALRA